MFFVVFWGGGRDCGVEFFEVSVLLVVVVVKVDYVDKVVVLDDVFWWIWCFGLVYFFGCFNGFF